MSSIVEWQQTSDKSIKIPLLEMHFVFNEKKEVSIMQHQLFPSHSLSRIKNIKAGKI